MLQDIEEGATAGEVARAPQIPCPKMLVKVDDPVMLVPIILMERLIPPQEETSIHA